MLKFHFGAFPLLLRCLSFFLIEGLPDGILYLSYPGCIDISEEAQIMIQYVVDAFTDKVFGGNPAAVCVMDHWPSEELMMSITRENNLSETAFTVKEGDGYRLRWFTPGGEIDLCGHATLGTAFIIMNYVDTDAGSVTFDTLSGKLTVKRVGDLYEMDFPAYELQPVEVTAAMAEAAGAMPSAAYMGRDLLCVFEDEAFVRTMSPDMEKVKELDGLLLHATAKGNEYHCVSRSFAPKLSVNEDPVCGSGHCHIAPYWFNELGLDSIVAYQASRRGGVLYCSMDNGRIRMSGKAALYSKAELFV